MWIKTQLAAVVENPVESVMDDGLLDCPDDDDEPAQTALPSDMQQSAPPPLAAPACAVHVTLNGATNPPADDDLLVTWRKVESPFLPCIVHLQSIHVSFSILQTTIC